MILRSGKWLLCVRKTTGGAYRPIPTIRILTTFQGVATHAGSSGAGVRNVIPDHGNDGLGVWSITTNVGGGGVGVHNLMEIVRNGYTRVCSEFGLEADS